MVSNFAAKVLLFFDIRKFIPIRSLYLPLLSRYIPDTFPTHTRYIRISHEYSTNTPRISHEYPKPPTKMIVAPLFLLAVLCTAVVCRVSSVLFCPFFSRSAHRRPLEYASFSPFYVHFYVHYLECYSGVHVYVVLCQSPALALKYPVYFLKIVAKILRKVIFCQNETLICEYGTSFS